MNVLCVVHAKIFILKSDNMVQNASVIVKESADNITIRRALHTVIFSMQEIFEYMTFPKMVC